MMKYIFIVIMFVGSLSAQGIDPTLQKINEIKSSIVESYGLNWEGRYVGELGDGGARFAMFKSNRKWRFSVEGGNDYYLNDLVRKGLSKSEIFSIINKEVDKFSRKVEYYKNVKAVAASPCAGRDEAYIVKIMKKMNRDIISIQNDGGRKYLVQYIDRSSGGFESDMTYLDYSNSPCD